VLKTCGTTFASRARRPLCRTPRRTWNRHRGMRGPW